MTQQDTVHRKHAEVILACGDTAYYYPAPRRGDTVYCRTCATFQLVTRLAADRRELKIKCEQCQFIRAFPLDQTHEALVKADTHSLRRGHTVAFYDEHGLRKRVGKTGR